MEVILDIHADFFRPNALTQSRNHADLWGVVYSTTVPGPNLAPMSEQVLLLLIPKLNRLFWHQSPPYLSPPEDHYFSSDQELETPDHFWTFPDRIS